MALPILETPTFELTIPSTKETFKFRPFLVKEEKLLMLASESGQFQGMVEACQQVVTNCSFGELDGTKQTMFDLQYLFIQLRSNSVGKDQTFTLTCGGCEKQTPYKLNLEDMEVHGLEDEVNNKITINDTMGLVLKYPSSTLLASPDLTDYDIICGCLDYVYTEEETISAQGESKEEIENFIDALPISAMNQIRDYFEKMPLVEYVVDYKCNEEGCGHENKISINGAEQFVV